MFREFIYRICEALHILFRGHCFCACLCGLRNLECTKFIDLERLNLEDYISQIKKSDSVFLSQAIKEKGAAHEWNIHNETNSTV